MKRRLPKGDPQPEQEAQAPVRLQTEVAPPPNDEVLDIQGLALLLKRSASTIASDMVRSPESVPPAFRLPNSRRPLWLRATVMRFLEHHAGASNALPEQYPPPARSRVRSR